MAARPASPPDLHIRSRLHHLRRLGTVHLGAPLSHQLGKDLSQRLAWLRAIECGNLVDVLLLSRKRPAPQIRGDALRRTWPEVR
jgi:hypothetical protein